MLLCELMKCAELKMFAFFCGGVKTEEVGGEVIVAKMQAFSTCRGLVCCTWSHATISSFYIWCFGRKSLLHGMRWEGKNTVWLCCFSPIYEGKAFLQKYWHTASTFWVPWESLWCPFSYVSFCFWENCGFNEVTQKFSVVTDFLKFLFPRNWKDLGSSGSFSCKWKIVLYS